jgi:hypothetical protein
MIFAHHHMNTMNWLLLLLQAGVSQAALRFGCSSVSIQRLDPLVEPGNIPSAHVCLLALDEES